MLPSRAQASAEHGHSEMLKLLATDGPLKSITKPINDAVEWVTGGGEKDDAHGDAHATEQKDGDEKTAEKGEAAVKHANCKCTQGIKLCVSLPRPYGRDLLENQQMPCTAAGEADETDKAGNVDQENQDEAEAGKEDAVTSTASIA